MLHPLNSRGNALLFVMVLAAVIGVVAQVLASKFTSATQQVMLVRQKIEKENLENQIHAVLQSSLNCSCQLDRTLNTTDAATLNLDTTQPNIPDVQLNNFRTGCDFSSDQNILAQRGKALPHSMSGLSVESIRLTNLRRGTAPDSVSGKIQVTVAGVIPLSVSQEVSLQLDLSSGTPSSRRIASCGFWEGRISSCPAGWLMFGAPKAVGTFCVEQRKRPARNWDAALVECANSVLTSDGVASLCNPMFLYQACRALPDLDMESGWEWSSLQIATNIPGLEYGTAVSNTSCNQTQYQNKSSSRGFRCCLGVDP